MGHVVCHSSDFMESLHTVTVVIIHGDRNMLSLVSLVLFISLFFFLCVEASGSVISREDECSLRSGAERSRR